MLVAAADTRGAAAAAPADGPCRVHLKISAPLILELEEAVYELVDDLPAAAVYADDLMQEIGRLHEALAERSGCAGCRVRALLSDYNLVWTLMTLAELRPESILGPCLKFAFPIILEISGDEELPNYIEKCFAHHRAQAQRLNDEVGAIMLHFRVVHREH